MNARQRSRRKALQALYQWVVSVNTNEEIEMQFLEDNTRGRFDVEYFQKLFNETVKYVEELDTLFSAHLDRDKEQIDPIELSILRMGSYELKYCIEVPYKVVINEAVVLAKQFGATDSHKYVNGVLDKLAHQFRQTEINAENT